LNKNDGKSNFTLKKEKNIFIDGLHINKKYDQNLWYLDTRYSNHMSADKSIFSSLDESYQDLTSFVMLMLMRKEGFTFIDRDEYDFESE
jgi:hypothetical protein